MSVSQTSAAILVARHLVAAALCAMLIPDILFGFPDGWWFWAQNYIGSVGFAVLLTGLLWLFFTSTVKGKVVKTFAILLWSLLFLQLLNSWRGTDVPLYLTGGLVLAVLAFGFWKFVKPDEHW